MLCAAAMISSKSSAISSTWRILESLRIVSRSMAVRSTERMNLSVSSSSPLLVSVSLQGTRPAIGVICSSRPKRILSPEMDAAMSKPWPSGFVPMMATVAPVGNVNSASVAKSSTSKVLEFLSYWLTWITCGPAPGVTSSRICLVYMLIYSPSFLSHTSHIGSNVRRSLPEYAVTAAGISPA